MQLTDLIYHKKQHLTKDECAFLIDEFEKNAQLSELEHCAEATTGEDTYSSFDRISLPIGSEGWQIVHNATEKMINEYHDYLDGFNAFHIGFRNVLNYSHMTRLLRYRTGTKIHPHTDHGPFVYGSCTFNLNDNYTGGEFSWFKGKDSLKLGLGDGLIFPADYFWVHEVREITSGTRYSTNSFLQEICEPMKDKIYEFLSMMQNSPAPNAEIQKYIDARYNIKK